MPVWGWTSYDRQRPKAPRIGKPSRNRSKNKAQKKARKVNR